MYIIARKYGGEVVNAASVLHWGDAFPLKSGARKQF